MASGVTVGLAPTTDTPEPGVVVVVVAPDCVIQLPYKSCNGCGKVAKLAMVAYWLDDMRLRNVKYSDSDMRLLRSTSATAKLSLHIRKSVVGAMLLLPPLGMVVAVVAKDDEEAVVEEEDEDEEVVAAFPGMTVALVVLEVAMVPGRTLPVATVADVPGVNVPGETVFGDMVVGVVVPGDAVAAVVVPGVIVIAVVVVPSRLGVIVAVPGTAEAVVVVEAATVAPRGVVVVVPGKDAGMVVD